MPTLIPSYAHSIGQTRHEAGGEPSNNHYNSKKISSGLKQKIADMGLERVAGNVFICKSSKEYWEVKNGKIVRMVSPEISDGSIIAAPRENPQSFLIDILGGIEF